MKPIATRLVLAIATLGLFSLAQAETPNIEPGQWEYETRITVEGPFAVPEQTDTSSDCVTEEDIADAQSMMGEIDTEECEVTREEMRADGASYELLCQMDGVSMTMTMELTFMGDQSEGLIISETETPMGPMKSTMKMTGRRIGECE